MRLIAIQPANLYPTRFVQKDFSLFRSFSRTASDVLTSGRLRLTHPANAGFGDKDVAKQGSLPHREPLPYPAPLEDNMGRKQPKYPDGSNTHQIHTPTSDHRMDAEGKDAKQKDLNQRQTGHQQTGDPPGKRRTSNKPAERPETEPLM